MSVHRRGSPRGPESRDVEFGGVHCGSPTSPLPPLRHRGSRAWRCWLLFVCLRGTEVRESEGPRRSAVLPGRLPGPPLRADMPLGGVGAPQAAGRGVSGRRAARPLTKPGSGPCTYALPRRGRPCAGRASRASAGPLRAAASRDAGPGEGFTPVPGSRRCSARRGRSCSRAACGASMLGRPPHAPAPSRPRSPGRGGSPAHPAPPHKGQRGCCRLLATGHISGAAIYCPWIAPETGLAHKAIHTQQWGFSQQLTRNNIIKPFTKPSLFTIN